MSQRQLIRYETYFDGIGYCKEFGKYTYVHGLYMSVYWYISMGFMMQTLVG